MKGRQAGQMLQVETDCVKGDWSGDSDWVALAQVAVTAAVAASPHARLIDGPMLCEVSVRLTDNDEVQALNRDYRGKDKPTNVLSFPASPEERSLSGTIGDLVVCAPVVAAEARVQRKARDAHWAHIVVHGVLHLHGYDHERSARAAREMEALEVEILRGFGYLDPYSPVTSRTNE